MKQRTHTKKKELELTEMETELLLSTDNKIRCVIDKLKRTTHFHICKMSVGQLALDTFLKPLYTADHNLAKKQRLSESRISNLKFGGCKRTLQQPNSFVVGFPSKSDRGSTTISAPLTTK